MIPPPIKTPNLNLTVIILTKDEEIHIERAIRSVKEIAKEIYVVDSGSSDRTTILAKACGAEVLSHTFLTQAKQFNWALSQMPAETDWVLRLDADEIVTPGLKNSIKSVLPRSSWEVAGAYVNRRVIFMGRPIRWGGVFPNKNTRIFRLGRGHSDDRWMDEHIVLDGQAIHLQGEIIDENLNSLGWWIDKHNRYASREVVEILDRKYKFLKRPGLRSQDPGAKNSTKRKIYARLPVGLRTLLYFTYRYIFRLGFLDGSEGRAFHFLQGFWYRYLVDMKLRQVELALSQKKLTIENAVQQILGIDLHDTTDHRDAEAVSATSRD